MTTEIMANERAFLSRPEAKRGAWTRKLPSTR